MTKLKSKKMSKSTFAVIIMAIVMVAMLAFGGTYAYFTATTDAVTGSATTGIVNVTQGAIANVTEDKVVTNTVIADGVQFTNKSDVAIYAIFAFTVKIDGADAAQSTISYTMDTTNTWEDVEHDGVTYKVAKLAAATTAGVSVPVCGEITYVGSSTSTNGTQGAEMGKPITISVQTWAIQQHSVTTAQAAVEAVIG